MTLMTSRREQSELYTEVQQFYANQMQLLDGGDADGFAATFTDKAEFAHSPSRTPLHSREQIAEEAREFRRRDEANSAVRRHWLNMLNVREEPDDTVVVAHYALIVTVKNGTPTIGPSCLTTDTFVREDGVLKVCNRQVRPD